MFDFYLTTNKTYVLGAVSIEQKDLLVTSTDMSIFETAFKAVESDDIRLTTLLMLETTKGKFIPLIDTAFIDVPYIEIPNSLMLEFEKEEILNFIFNELKNQEITEEDYGNIFFDNIRKLVDIIDEYSNKLSTDELYSFEQWRGTSIQTNGDLDINKIFVHIPEGIRFENPNEEIIFKLPQASQVIRALSFELDSNDFMFKDLSDNISNSTSEFNDDAEFEELASLDILDISPDMEKLIDFFYFENRFVSREKVNLFEEAIKSIYYKKNLMTIECEYSDELKDMIVGSTNQTPEKGLIPKNRENLYKYLNRLVDDLLMYETKIFCKIVLDGKGSIRSKIADNFINSLICQMGCINYAYTGKMSNKYVADIKDDEDTLEEFAVQIIGFNRITKSDDNTYVSSMLDADMLINKDLMTLNGDELLEIYARQFVNRYAYSEIYVKMLNFGETKNRYIQIYSSEQVERPYFDTETFTMQKIVFDTKPFYEKKWEDGSTFILKHQVFLNSTEFNIKTPVGVVLSKIETNDQIDREVQVFIDITSFFGMIRHISDDKEPLLSISGIDQIKTTIDREKLLSRLENNIYCLDVKDKMFSQEDDFGVKMTSMTASQISREIMKLCENVKIDKNNIPTILSSMCGIEDMKYTVSNIREVTQKDITFKIPYVEKILLQKILPNLIAQSEAANNSDVSVIDYIEKVIQVKEDVSEINFDAELRSGIVQSAKLYSNSSPDKKHIGYMFKRQINGKSSFLIVSKDDAGLDIPTPKEWFAIDATKAIIPMIKRVSDKEPSEALKLLRDNSNAIFKSYKSIEDILKGCV